MTATHQDKNKSNNSQNIPLQKFFKPILDKLFVVFCVLCSNDEIWSTNVLNYKITIVCRSCGLLNYCNLKHYGGELFFLKGEDKKKPLQTYTYYIFLHTTLLVKISAYENEHMYYCCLP